MRGNSTNNDSIRAGETVLVTGGAGYLGTVLVGRLLRRGLRVRVLDNLRFGGLGLVPLLSHPRFELLPGDLCVAPDVERAVDGAAAVVHLAAIVGEPACDREPSLARQVNRDGTELLAARCRGAAVRRFLFASTCSVYGAGVAGDEFVDERSAARPLSDYGRQKLDAEAVILDLAGSGIAATSLRFATAFGLSPRPRFDLTVNHFARDLALGRELEVHASDLWRPYCHTRDLARCCLLALEAEAQAVAGEIFNVGATDENHTKREIVELIGRELDGEPTRVRHVAGVVDPRNYRVDFTKVTERLGFRNERRVDDGIREIVFAVRSRAIPDPDDVRYRN